MSGAYAGARQSAVPYSTRPRWPGPWSFPTAASSIRAGDGGAGFRADRGDDGRRVAAGGTEPFRHVWRREGRVVANVAPRTTRLTGKQMVLRLRSTLPPEKIPAERTGSWTVDVETADGQLVGRAAFAVER